MYYIADRSGSGVRPGLRPPVGRDRLPRGWWPSADVDIGQVMAARDGRWLMLRTAPAPPATPDILGLRLGDSTPVPLVASAVERAVPDLSPDGRWLAYASDESGALEVYVRPFPETAGAKWQVSTAGGSQPTWSSTGRELFYVNGKNDMVSAEIPPGTTFSVGAQRVLFSMAQFAGGGLGAVLLAEPRRQAVPGAAGGRGRTAGGAGRGGELGAAAGRAGREVGRRVAHHRGVAGPTARRSVLGRGGDGIAPFGRCSSRHAGVGLLQEVEVVASTDAPCGSHPVAPAPRAFGKAARALPGPRRAGGADVPRGARQ